MRKIILASGSPRRKEILKKLIGEDFSVVKSGYEEDNSLSMPPAELALEHARGKAKDVASQLEEGIVIGADSFVCLDGHILGKPKDVEDAKRMLRLQSKKTIKVYTGIALIDIERKKKEEAVEVTSLNIREITDEEIDKYIATQEPFGKAGAFGAQDKGAIFIKSIEGDFWNIVGLPMHTLSKMLKKLDVDVLD